MRIGIYGGKFNPVHNAHLQVAQHALEQLKLDRLLFVPTGIPPLKAAAELVRGEHRLAMLRLAIAGQPGLIASDFEVLREQKSFTIDTVRHYVGEYPADTEFFFILGDDIAARLHHWKGIYELQRLVRFVSVGRSVVPLPPGTSAPQKIDRGLSKVAAIATATMVMPAMPISSTQLRAKLRAGYSVRDLTPRAVVEYIERYGLYQAESSQPTEPA